VARTPSSVTLSPSPTAAKIFPKAAAVGNSIDYRLRLRDQPMLFGWQFLPKQFAELIGFTRTKRSLRKGVG
jgi:hypothetical protein